MKINQRDIVNVEFDDYNGTHCINTSRTSKESAIRCNSSQDYCFHILDN